MLGAVHRWRLILTVREEGEGGGYRSDMQTIKFDRATARNPMTRMFHARAPDDAIQRDFEEYRRRCLSDQVEINRFYYATTLFKQFRRARVRIFIHR